MSKAEELLDEYGCPDVPFDEMVTMYYPAILEAMEAYHQSRLKEVSDEIKEEIDDSDDTEEIVFYEGAKWLLDKLKQ